MNDSAGNNNMNSIINNQEVEYIYPTQTLTLKDGRNKPVKYINSLLCLSVIFFGLGLISLVLGCFDVFFIPLIYDEAIHWPQETFSLPNCYGFPIWFGLLAILTGILALRVKQRLQMSKLCNLFFVNFILFLSIICFWVIFIITIYQGKIEYPRIGGLESHNQITFALLLTRIFIATNSILIFMASVLIIVLYFKPVASHDQMENVQLHCCYPFRGCCIYGYWSRGYRGAGINTHADDDRDWQHLFHDDASSMNSDATATTISQNRFISWLVRQPSDSRRNRDS